MDRNEIAIGLRELAANAYRSKAARLRDIAPEVEATLAAGVPRSVVLDELARHGLKMTLATFSNALYRIRRKAARRPTTPLRPDNHHPNVKEAPAAGRSHDPADIDRIMQTAPDLNALAKLTKRKSK